MHFLYKNEVTEEVTEDIISPEVIIITFHPVNEDVHSDSKKEKYEEQAPKTAGFGLT